MVQIPPSPNQPSQLTITSSKSQNAPFISSNPTNADPTASPRVVHLPRDLTTCSLSLSINININIGTGDTPSY